MGGFVLSSSSFWLGLWCVVQGKEPEREKDEGGGGGGGGARGQTIKEVTIEKQPFSFWILYLHCFLTPNCHLPFHLSICRQSTCTLTWTFKF